MENDMLSTLMHTDQSKLLLRKMCRVALVLILLNAVCVVVDICDWYLYLIKPTKWLIQDKYYVFNCMIRPVASGMELTLSTIAYVANYKGYQALHAGFEKEDAALVHKGFKNLFLVLVLTALTFSIVILSMSYRLFILR